MGENNKVIFITGASRGLGATLATVALDLGYSVIATGRNPEAIAQTLGGPSERLLVLRLDVTQEAEAQAAVKAAIDRFGRIDVLINNAGYGLLGRIEECAAQEVEAQFQTNVFGLLNVTRAMLPILRAQRSGHIFNISSLAGYRGAPGGGIYCATKFAVEAISEALAGEVASFGVQVTTVGPGFFRTEFLSSDSLAYPQHEIDAYGPSGREFWEQKNGKQEGDPVKLAHVLYRFANAQNAPLRLPMGKDAVKVLGEKIESLQKGLDEVREVASSPWFEE